MRYLVALLLFVPSLALAQQPSPSNIALQINTAVSNMALSLERETQTVTALQQQLNAAQAEVKRLTDKYEPKKPEEKKP